HLLRLRPQDPTTHAMLGALAYQYNSCVEAAGHFSKSGSVMESKPGALQEYGGCLVKLKQADQAVAVFKRAVELNPNDTRTRAQLATIQLIADKPKEALEPLTALLKTNSADAKTLRLASSAYEASGDTPQAVKILREAIVNDPRNVDLYLDFANLCMDH